MLTKKITTIQPLKARWSPPHPDSPWDNNSFASFTRLLQSDAFHIEDPGINMSSDIYFISSFDIALIEKEITFAQKIKSMGKKIVVSFSQDLRFLIGNCLVNSVGIHYGELCKLADVILQGISPKIKVYGRYQEKAIDFGLPFERLNFSLFPYDQRDIDIFVSNNIGEENLGFTVEFLLSLKEQFPNKKIVYSTNLGPQSLTEELKQKVIFVPAGLLPNLKKAKMYINLELRPRPGRSLIEAFYCRTPFISCEAAYHSRLFPEFTFSHMSIVDIVNLCGKMLETEYNALITKAETLAEYDYFDNFYPRLEKKLYG